MSEHIKQELKDLEALKAKTERQIEKLTAYLEQYDPQPKKVARRKRTPKVNGVENVKALAALRQGSEEAYTQN